MKRINLLDLAGEYELFADEVRRTANDVLDSQQFVNGPAVGELEQALASRLDAGHAVAVSSGTDALLCSLMALGVGVGDEVILPTFTFIATAGVVARSGATPVFVDIDPKTFNLDPGLLEKAITPKTKAIIVVHLFGQCAEMKRINTVADWHEIPVIEDAAQAICATYHGRQACTLGKIACLSFYPTKNLGGFGEGGMVLTGDEELAGVVRSLRNHGEAKQRYVCGRVGANFRLDTMKAALLLIKLKHLSDFTERRQRNAKLYDELLKNSPVTPPYVPEHHKPVYHQYSILCEQRDELRDHLAECGVGSAVYYPIPLHLQECFKPLGYNPGDLPVSEETGRRILSLPCHPMLSEDDVRHVARCVLEFSRTSIPQSTEA